MNTQKVFLPILGLLLFFGIIGLGVYLYTQSSLDFFNIKKTDSELESNFNTRFINNTDSCSKNTDCQKNEFCYFKPEGEKGSCTRRWDQEGKETKEYLESKSLINKNNLIPCSKDEECKEGKSCLLVPGGNTGYCSP